MNAILTSLGDRSTPRSRHAMLQFQQRQFQRLLSHVWNRSAFYRDYYTSYGINERDLADISISDLPLLPKKTLIDNFDRAVVDPRLKRAQIEEWFESHRDPAETYCEDTIVIHGSGTTGDLGIFAYDRKAWALAEVTMAGRLPLPENYPMGKTKVAFYLSALGHFMGVSMASSTPKSIYDTLILSLLDSSEQTVKQLNAFQPHRLTGYSSSVAHLAELALAGRLAIQPQRVFVGGDKLTESMERKIREAWGAPLYIIYAASESKYIAIKTPEHDQLMVMDDLNIVEVLDEKNQAVGAEEEGRVVLTNLYNYTLPMLRYELGDYVVKGTALPDGPFTTLRDIRGRVNDALPVALASGLRDSIHPIVLTTFHVPTLEKVQFVSANPEHVRIDYVAPDNIDIAVQREFQQMLDAKGARRTSVEVRHVPAIANDSRTGKLRIVRFEEQQGPRPSQALRMDAQVFGSRPMHIEPDPSFVPIAKADIEQSSLAATDGRTTAREPARSAEAGSSFATADLTGSIDRRFAQVAVQHPDHPAVIDGERQLTYEQLDRLATQVAGALVRRGFDASRPVAVLCGHGLELLPLILGVVRAGGFYVPLDTHLPSGRLQFILAEAGPEYLLAGAAQREAAANLANERIAVLCLEEMEASPPNPFPTVAPETAACLLYTSGSTGVPKGVILSHSAILERAARYAADYHLHRGDRLSLLQSYAVSAGTREIFGALLTGATLAFYDVGARGLAGLAHWLNHTSVTVFYVVPTIFRLFLDTLTEQTFPTVRVVRLGGEPVQEYEVSGFRRYFPPGCILANGYAASETDTICQFLMDHDTRIVAGRIPAGHPVPGVDVALCDERGTPIEGALGEIRVAGRMLASGYWDARSGKVQPFDLPFATGDLGFRLADGRIFLAGRRDLIVKVHGYRIHLGEIERAVSGVRGVVEAAAVSRPASHGDTTIVVYYVTADQTASDTAELRRAVAAVVPRPAQPTAYVHLPALPRLPGGKVNRSSLSAQPKPGGQPAADDPVYTSDVEARLARIWRDVLQVPAPARDLDFFDASGDSVSAFRVLSRIKAEFGVDLSVSEFFARSVLADLAQTIDGMRAGQQ